MSPRQVSEIRAMYDAAANGYDQRHAQPRDLATARRLQSIYNHTASNGRTLELGCGTGLVLAQLGSDAVGIDVSAGMLGAAKRRGLRVAQADCHALPFASGSFSGVVAPGGVIRYCDPSRFFSEAARVLLPGGRLAVHQFCRTPLTLRSRAAAATDDLHINRPQELIDPARNAGLRYTEGHFFRRLPFPPFIVRLPSYRLRLWTQCVLEFAKT